MPDARELPAGAVVLCMRVADMPVPAFAGDLIGSCMTCGLPVRFRPYMPAELPKVCSVCAGFPLLPR